MQAISIKTEDALNGRSSPAFGSTSNKPLFWYHGTCDDIWNAPFVLMPVEE